MSAEELETTYCSFCDREDGQSHTESCPARDDEGEYVQPEQQFAVAVKAIGDGLDRRDAIIATLVEALEAILTASQPPHSFGHVFIGEAQELARTALAKAKAAQP